MFRRLCLSPSSGKRDKRRKPYSVGSFRESYPSITGPGLFPFTWGRRQIQSPKRPVFSLLKIRTMDKVRKPISLTHCCWLGLGNIFYWIKGICIKKSNYLFVCKPIEDVYMCMFARVRVCVCGCKMLICLCCVNVVLSVWWNVWCLVVNITVVTLNSDSICNNFSSYPYLCSWVCALSVTGTIHTGYVFFRVYI
jgi:hypothetical protein